MKKTIIFISLITLFLFTSCTFDYVGKTKKVAVPRKIVLNEQEVTTIEDVSVLLIKYFLENENIAEIREKSKWKAEGDLGENLKMVVVTYKEVRVEIEVEKRGDYVEVDPFKIVARYKGDSAKAYDLLIKDVIDIFIK